MIQFHVTYHEAYLSAGVNLCFVIFFPFWDVDFFVYVLACYPVRAF